MRDTFKILFMSRREKEIFKHCLEHIKKTLEGVELLKKAIPDLCQEEYKKKEEIVERVLAIEKECDKKAEEITKDIVELIKYPANREDLLKFIRELERVTKAVEATAYRIEMCHKFEVPGVLKKDLERLVGSVVLTVGALEKTIEHMPFNTEDALEHSERIHMLEEKVDDIRRELMKDLLKVGNKIRQTDFYLLIEIIEKLEDISDRCDDAGAMIELIVVSK